MDAAPTADDLLRHFDPDQEAAPRFSPRGLPTRGIRWVLKWFAALGVLSFAASSLVEFAYLTAAEQTLARAARAGALEATLPRATMRSITDTVQRRIAAHPALSSRLRLMVENNGRPVVGPHLPQQGDHLSVTLTASTRAVLPHWLRTLRFWESDQPIRVRIERTMPGRVLTERGTSPSGRGRELSSG